jgi:diguanylate cyclase (GGDEF)-like protein/PAS domain S-box-containing protein
MPEPFGPGELPLLRPARAPAVVGAPQRTGHDEGGPPPAADAGPSPVIVVVDDRNTNRLIFSRLAASIGDGASVEAFSDAPQMLAWMTDGHVPDLVITDYKMPGMDGAEFIRRLRALPQGADVPVIVITAYEDRDFRLRALDAGATDFLQSPVDHQEFVTRGRNLLKLGQQQKMIRGRAEDLARELERSEQSRESAIRDSRTRLIQVIDTIQAVISAVDEEGRRVFVNQYGAALLSPVPDEASSQLDNADARVLATGAPIQGYEEELIDRHGRKRTFLTSKFPLQTEAGAARTVLTTSFDISERKQAEQALRHLAHHDTLTGLPNRLLLHDVLNAELAKVRPPGSNFALHFVDLDRFKGINDGFGHDHGDRLLREIAARLLLATRLGDSVARLGGDEFAIVQCHVESAADAELFAQRIIAAVAEPFEIEHHHASIGASIGITLAPADAANAEQLLKNADLAMYRAKREGRGCARFFAAEMQTVARASVLLEIDLRASVERHDFVLHYQPLVDAQTGLVVGAEALLRWPRPGHGLVYPGSFLPLAEDTGLIVPINRWVLGEACRQAAAWAAAGTPVPVGVNISSAMFRLENVRDLIIATLERTGLDPALLELELTEGTLLDNQAEVAGDLHALRGLGVRVAIDDFGTGYSSLAYLQLLPIDRLKVDRSFIRDLDASGNGGAIVEAVVGIGRSLNMEVLAEGVETQTHLARVARAGCRFVQGYFFSKPVPPEVFATYLREGVRLPVRQVTVFGGQVPVSS